MPQVFKVSGYLIYFWTNESDPLEPIHFHITEGEPTQNATKVWLTQSGHCLLCNNKSKIPEAKLRKIMEIAEARKDELESRWLEYFGEIRYYC